MQTAVGTLSTLLPIYTLHNGSPLLAEAISYGSDSRSGHMEHHLEQELETIQLKARRDALDDYFGILTEDELSIAEKAIDKYIDYLEEYEKMI